MNELDDFFFKATELDHQEDRQKMENEADEVLGHNDLFKR